MDENNEWEGYTSGNDSDENSDDENKKENNNVSDDILRLCINIKHGKDIEYIFGCILDKYKGANRDEKIKIIWTAIKFGKYHIVKFITDLPEQIDTKTFYSLFNKIITINYTKRISNCETFEFIYKNYDINGLGEDESYFIPTACIYDDVNTVKFFINKGYDVNKLCLERSQYPLVLALCNFEIVKILLENYANPNIRLNNSIIYEAVGIYDCNRNIKQLDIIMLLFNYGANMFEKNKKFGKFTFAFNYLHHINKNLYQDIANILLKPPNTYLSIMPKDIITSIEPYLLEINTNIKNDDDDFFPFY